MIAMTMMVRDEADVVGAMIEHHLAQGIDLFLVTDNGSVDGTVEILQSFEARGLIEVAHDPRHLKQQHEVVTRMSREAATRGATWVLNADADEFWVAKDPALTVAEELSLIDPAVGAFPVPVIDMTGPPALAGTGLGRLVYRDERPDEVMAALGIHAHSTPDVAFVARHDVEVAQGNHFVNVAESAPLDPQRGLQVYHFPWRSWSQFARKVENAGRAYAASPDLRPSANHHGMRDWRRAQDGVLRPSYVARHPSRTELADGIAHGWFVEDRRLAHSLRSPTPDEPLDEAVEAADREIMSALVGVELRLNTLEQEHRRASDDLDFERRHVRELDTLVERLRDEISESQKATSALRDELDATLEEVARAKRSRLVRGALRLSKAIHS